MWTGTMPTTFGMLAPIGYLDNLTYERGKGNVEFTVVGFGLQGAGFGYRVDTQYAQDFIYRR